MTTDRYDAWCDTPRGRWVGSPEWALLRSAVGLRAADPVLDAGLGTGWFVWRAVAEGAPIVDLDRVAKAVGLARRQSLGQLRFLAGNAICLPFEDRSA